MRKLLRVWRSPHLLRSFRSNVLVNFFEFLCTEFAACSKPTSRDSYRKASYPRTQQRAMTRAPKKRRLYSLDHAADKLRYQHLCGVMILHSVRRSCLFRVAFFYSVSAGFAIELEFGSIPRFKDYVLEKKVHFI